MDLQIASALALSARKAGSAGTLIFPVILLMATVPREQLICRKVVIHILRASHDHKGSVLLPGQKPTVDDRTAARATFADVGPCHHHCIFTDSNLPHTTSHSYCSDPSFHASINSVFFFVSASIVRITRSGFDCSRNVGFFSFSVRYLGTCTVLQILLSFGPSASFNSPA